MIILYYAVSVNSSTTKMITNKYYHNEHIYNEYKDTVITFALC